MRLPIIYATLGLFCSALSQSLFAQSVSKDVRSSIVKGEQLRQPQVDAAQLRLVTKLPDNKRLELMNRARAELKLPPVSRPPASTTRVSAKTPVSSAGALIQQARSQTYVGPTQSDPDGYFALGAATANGGGDYIKVSFPVEAGKLYLLECRVRSEGNVPIQFSGEVGAPVTESVAPADDHVIVVVRAAGTRLTRVLQSKARHWWWSACDIAPTG